MVESSLSVQWAVQVHKNDLWGGKALVDWQLTKKNLNGGKKRKRCVCGGEDPFCLIDPT